MEIRGTRAEIEELFNYFQDGEICFKIPSQNEHVECEILGIPTILYIDYSSDIPFSKEKLHEVLDTSYLEKELLCIGGINENKN